MNKESLLLEACRIDDAALRATAVMPHDIRQHYCQNVLMHTNAESRKLYYYAITVSATSGQIVIVMSV